MNKDMSEKKAGLSGLTGVILGKQLFLEIYVVFSVLEKTVIYCTP